MHTSRGLCLAAGFVLYAATCLLADGGRHGRSSRLSPPDGAPFPEARGEVVLNHDVLLVKVEGLGAGDYQVLLDDGKGTKSPIGSITVKPEAEEGGGGSAGEEDDEGDEEEDDDDDDHDGRAGFLLLRTDLPFGATSPLDLAGRPVCVTDKDGKIVLAGNTPSPIVEEPERRNGRCPLARPEPPVDPDAAGVLKLESGEGRMVIKVHLDHLDPGKVYEITLTNPADHATESLGKATIDEDGEGHFKLDSEKGDAIPFGAGDLAALKGFGVSVKDESGAVVLVGAVCDAQPRPPDHDGDHEGDDGHLHPRCFSAEMTGGQETPPVTTDATGTALVLLRGETGATLRYRIEVSGLSGPATGAHIHKGALGVKGPVVIPLDAATLRGEVEVPADQLEAFLADLRAGNLYVNVHTAANPDGEIRGQLAACAGDDDDDDEHEDEHEDDDDDHEEDHEGETSGGGGGVVAPVEEPMFLMAGRFDAPFLRGDPNRDGTIDVADPVTVLFYLFAGGARPYCEDAADADDNGVVELTDAVSLLNYLFLDGDAPAAPGTFITGSDSTADGLYCEELP